MIAVEPYGKFNLLPTAFNVLPINRSECDAILSDWRRDDLSKVPIRLQLGLKWNSGVVWQNELGEVLALRTASGIPLGMLEYFFDAEMTDGTGALGGMLLAQRPVIPSSISSPRVSRRLMMRLIQISIELGFNGQVVLPEALGPDSQTPNLNPKAIYEHFGFRTIRPVGWNSYRMELTAQKAENFLKECQSQRIL